MKSSIVKLSLALTLIAALAVSCSKENQQPLADQQLSGTEKSSAAALLTCTPGDVVIVGDTGYARDASSFDPRYYNFVTGSTSSSGAWVRFARQSNSFIFPQSGYTLKYLSPSPATDLCDLTATHYASAADADSIGQASGSTPGWYTYSLGVPTPVSNFYVFVTHTASSTVYAVKLVEFQNIWTDNLFPNPRVVASPRVQYRQL